MEKKLEVKNLIVSFRTVSGKVQAVRNISFDLNTGETLAIVGESGSGKSVTSKAIIGILAGNSIIEGGEIIYDGKDLLRIGEDDFYRIRGDKIAMIFQDPLSSLNPIMKIGKQLMEAMLLKGKARQRASRKTFNEKLTALKNNMAYAGISEETAKALCADFDKFEFKHLECEKPYFAAIGAAGEAVEDIENILFLIEKNACDIKQKPVIKEMLSLCRQSVSEYVVSKDEERDFISNIEQIQSAVSKIRTNKQSEKFKGITENLNFLHTALEKSINKTKPNFFAMGYYKAFSNQAMPEMPVEELNDYLEDYLNKNFMANFISQAEKAIAASANRSYKEKSVVVEEIKRALPVLKDQNASKEKTEALIASLTIAVKKSIDPLEIVKDSKSYTFESSMKNAVEIYYKGIKKNASEQKKYDDQKKKYDRLCSKGKTPSWKLVPAAVIDLSLARKNISDIAERLLEHYEHQLKTQQERNYHDETIAFIDYLRLNASGCVHKVTRMMAKHKALKLMEEVGIQEPRKRFKQYPFEFSGGMRQRIVIAIALAADPDILICDEPTTALDVTIQSQILELINKIKKDRNLSIIFITHDLGVVAHMADKIAVMYAGKIVEQGKSEELFYEPAHPYTWALLTSMPDLDTNEKLEAIPGTPPNMIFPPKGDAFADRNKYALKIDYELEPPLFKITDTHYAATWLLHPDAPNIGIPKAVTDRIERMKKLGGEDNNE